MMNSGRTIAVREESNPRDVALTALYHINNNGKKANVFLREILDRSQKLDSRDKALCEHMVSATLDHLYSIDKLLDAYSKTNLSKMNPVIREILRLGTAQLLYMDKIPASACINEANKLAKIHGLAGLSGFVNGVLRTVERDSKNTSGDTKFQRLMKDGAVRWSVPSWLYRKFAEDFGIDGAESIFASWLLLRKTSVRFNLSKGKSETEILKLIQKDGIEADRILENPPVYELSGLSGLGVAALTAFQKGYITVQDASAAQLVCFAPPKGGDYVVDLCAAPGGKTLAYADALHGTGTVDSRDVSPQKTEKIRESVLRCGFSNVKIKVADATVKDQDLVQRADLVIADTPCSGLGVVAKKPDIKKNLTPESILELKKLQQEILKTAVLYLKVGGRLVYSTCTVTKEENEENFDWAVKELPLKPLVKQRIQPDLHHDGFFIAVFEKLR